MADYRAMSDDQWLNDALMNYYIKLLNSLDDELRDKPVADTQPPRSLPRLSFARAREMSTFFFDRLFSEHHGYVYFGVSWWATKAVVDLKTVGEVLIPINLNCLHWVLIVVDVIGREFLICDPYGSADVCGAVSHVRRWLTDEAVEQLDRDDTSEWDIDSWEETVAFHYAHCLKSAMRRAILRTLCESCRPSSSDATGCHVLEGISNHLSSPSQGV